jgi:hypothetical protein
MNEKKKQVKKEQKKRIYRGYLRMNEEEKYILSEYFGGLSGLRDYAVNLVKVNREKHGNEWQPTLQN